MENFDIEQFAGRWYEIERTLSIFETLWNCPTTQISITGEGIQFERGAFASLFNRNHYHRILRSKLTAPDSRRPSRMEFTMRGITEPVKYVVLDTDYGNYSLVWSCYESRPLGGALGHFEYVWLLSRTPKMEPTFQQSLYTLLDDNGIRRFYLTKNRMNNCDNKLT
ncbi:apolipoprotein D-like [Centruroides vittatus]|uniref:apolipoprotein D-like n=1 Tax=Centruroides vittatus TaxID=120091 RepID=UPI00350F6AC6